MKWHDQGEKQFQGSWKTLDLRKRPVDQWSFNFLGNSTKNIHSAITKVAFMNFKVQ